MKRLRCLTVVITLLFLFSVVMSAIEPIDINAKGVILVDATDGHDIYSKNSDAKLYPASLTKLMTALLVAENTSDFNAMVTANKTAFEGLSDAGSTVGIKAGEEMSVDNLLICMLVASANESANILAEYVSGDVESFVKLMNDKAAELGLKSTHFENPHGLHHENHYTTAEDMAKIALEEKKHKRLVEICTMDKATIPATNIGDERFFFTTNSLISRYKELGYIYSLATGMKTGHTNAAGLCLVSSAENKDLSLIAVVLGADRDIEGKKGHFIESKKLLKWGFENFKHRTILSSATPVCEVKVSLARSRDYVVAHTAKDYTVLMPKDYDESKLELIPSAKKSIEAPVKKGDEVGTVLIRYDGRDYATMPLIAADTVERSFVLYVFDKIKNIMKNPIVITVACLVFGALFAYIIYVIQFNRRRRQYRGKRRYRR